MDVNTNSPMVSSRHMTEGVAKQAKTSSVLVKCVRCGSTMGCPRHCPHMYTWPLWVFAAEVCVEWQAAISTILVEGGGGVKITGSNGGRQGGGEQGHEEGYMQEERAQKGKNQRKGRETSVRFTYKSYSPNIRVYWVVSSIIMRILQTNISRDNCCDPTGREWESYSSILHSKQDDLQEAPTRPTGNLHGLQQFRPTMALTKCKRQYHAAFTNMSSLLWCQLTTLLIVSILRRAFGSKAVPSSGYLCWSFLLKNAEKVLCF